MTKAIVTDIEGTTSSIAFVKDVLFPYAAENLPTWLSDNCTDAAVLRQIESVAKLIDRPASDITAVTKQLLEWIDQDVKATPLKTLQGMLWKSGYENDDYSAHIYEDAVQKLQDWHAAGIPLYVYSSGSVQAQELFFQYSRYGDVRNLFSGHFDTSTGAKSDADSYRKIAAAIGIPPADILFLSDVESEISAAVEAGFDAVLVAREEEASSNSDTSSFDVARTFFDVPVSFAQTQ
jgi:enolase-phosphatase E1